MAEARHNAPRLISQGLAELDILAKPSVHPENDLDFTDAVLVNFLPSFITSSLHRHHECSPFKKQLQLVFDQLQPIHSLPQ